MSKAEERALKAYPVKITERDGYDENLRERKGFVKGYHQAEKDKELTWEDIDVLDEISTDVFKEDFDAGTKEYYQEVLKRFKDLKK